MGAEVGLGQFDSELRSRVVGEEGLAPDGGTSPPAIGGSCSFPGFPSGGTPRSLFLRTKASEAGPSRSVVGPIAHTCPKGRPVGRHLNGIPHAAMPAYAGSGTAEDLPARAKAQAKGFPNR